MSLLRKLHQPVCLGANAESWQLCYWLLREGKRRKKQPREEEEEETAERERGLGLSGSKRGFSHRDHCFAQASQGTGGYSNIYKGRAVISPGDRVHLSVTTSPHTQSPPACWHLLRSKKNKSAALWLKRGGTNVTESLLDFFLLDYFYLEPFFFSFCCGLPGRDKQVQEDKWLFLDAGLRELLITALKEAAVARASACRNADFHMEADHTG